MVQSKEFTHLNTQGEVHMVDISEKMTLKEQPSLMEKFTCWKRQQKRSRPK